MQGKIKFTYGKDLGKLRTVTLAEGQKVDIPAGIIHRAEALTDVIIFEVSSPELDDVIKLEDDYGRIGKGNDEATDRTLAKRSAKKKS